MKSPLWCPTDQRKIDSKRRAIWFQMSLHEKFGWKWIYGTLEQYVNVVQALLNLISNYWRSSIDGDNMAQVVTIIWMIWWRRNQKFWNDAFPVAFEVSRRAREALEDWLPVRCKSAAGWKYEHHHNWTKPHNRAIKYN